MKNHANHIGNSLQKYISKYNLEQFFLFVCLESHEQFFSYLAIVTITGDGAANLDLCFELTAFSSEGSFTCHTYCDTGPPFLRSKTVLGTSILTEECTVFLIWK
jgi:hypothetical protein